MHTYKVMLPKTEDRKEGGHILTYIFSKKGFLFGMFSFSLICIYNQQLEERKERKTISSPIKR